MTVAQRLTEAVAAVCPIHGVTIVTQGQATAAHNGATAQQITDAEAAIAAFDWSQAAHDAWLVVKARAAAKDEYDIHRVFRAMAAMLLDELNAHATKIKAILDAVDGSTTLANLKSAVALIADPPQRTINQVVTVLKSKIDADA